MSDAEEFMRLVILGLSALVAGVSLHAAWRHSADWRCYHDRSADLWLVPVNLGTSGIVLLVGQLVFGSEGIPVTWQAVVYAVCLGMISVGLVGLAHAQHRDRTGNHRE